MRIRSVKPEFWGHEIMASLPPYTQLLALALLNYADDEGYFLASPQSVRGALFPFEDDSTIIQRMLEDLSKIGYVVFGKSGDGRKIGKVVNFLKHQRIDRPQPSKIKASAVFVEYSTNVHGLLAVGMEQGTGNREQDIPAVGGSATPQPDLFGKSNQPQPSSIESPPPPSKKEKGPEKRQRRELLDALVSEGGHRDLSKVTRPVWGEAATALKIIREVEGDDLTVQLIHAVANAYRREWPQMSLTPSALAKHWATFRPQQKKEGQAPAGKYGVPPCHEWPQFCRDHFGWENLPPWPELDLNRRRQVHLTFEQSPQPA